MEPQVFYSQSGVATNLDDFTDVTGSLPSEPSELVQIVRGLFIHELAVVQQKERFSAERMSDRNIVGAVGF